MKVRHIKIEIYHQAMNIANINLLSETFKMRESEV